MATNVEVEIKVKILLLIFRGIGIKSSTNATICGEQARSEYVVARGGCVASADLCGEQEKREGIAEGEGASGISFQLNRSLEDELDCHCFSLKVMVEFKMDDVQGSSLSPLGIPPLASKFSKCLTRSLSSMLVKSTSLLLTLHNPPPCSSSPFTRRAAFLLIVRRLWLRAES